MTVSRSVRRRGRTAAALALAVLLALPVAALAPAGAAEAPAPHAKIHPHLLTLAPGEVGWAVVVFEAAPSPARLDELAKTFEVVHPWTIIPAVGVVGPREAILALASAPDVRQLDAGYATPALRESAPQIGAPTVWQDLGYTGEGVLVAVLDTGVDDLHPDLDDGKVARKVSFETYWAGVNGTEDTYGAHHLDGFGHGTHVASTVAGTGDVPGLFFPDRYVGVAPGASLLAVQLTTSGGPGIRHPQEDRILFSTWTGLDAVQWVTDQRDELDIRIASNSWGAAMAYHGYDECLDDPVAQAVAASMEQEPELIWVFAAGNEGGRYNSTTEEYDPVPETIRSPGCLPGVITVGAVDREDKVASFSSRGPTLGDGYAKPDVAAPGVRILAAKTMTPSAYWGVGIGWTRDPGQWAFYSASSGTSMAAPHVAGLLALMVEAAPCLTQATALELLQDTAVDVGDPGFDYDTGYGVVDAPAAVAAAEGLC